MTRNEPRALRGVQSVRAGNEPERRSGSGAERQKRNEEDEKQFADGYLELPRRVTNFRRAAAICRLKETSVATMDKERALQRRSR